MLMVYLYDNVFQFQVDMPFSSTTTHTTLNSAFNAVKSDEQIQARAIEFIEPLINVIKPVTFKGGFNAAYSGNSGGYSILKGKLTIGAGGKLIVQGLKIKP